MVVYADEDGSVATFHFMPTVYLPTTNIGYSPTATITSPRRSSRRSTGATVSFPNLYVDIQHIPWLAGGTAWVGTRYYKRESIYISDFFYWNPSGVGGGIEDINLGKDLRLSYAAFAIDGEPEPCRTAPHLAVVPSQTDFGVRNDLQLRGIRPYPSGEFQIGFQYIAELQQRPRTTQRWVGRDAPARAEGARRRQQLAFQYGRGRGHGLWNAGRFYYPDFSLYTTPNESRLRAVDVLTIQPTSWLGAQVGLVYQYDDFWRSHGLGKPTWYSAGGRVGVGVQRALQGARRGRL